MSKLDDCPMCGTWDVQKQVEGFLELGATYNKDGNIILEIWGARAYDGSKIQYQCRRCYHRWEGSDYVVVQEYSRSMQCSLCHKHIEEDDPAFFTNGGVFCSRECKKSFKATSPLTTASDQ